MPAAGRPHHHNRYPANATLRCRQCGRTGSTAQLSGHVARGKCAGAELSLVRVELDEPMTPPPPPPAPTVPEPEPMRAPFLVPQPPPVEPPPPAPQPEEPPAAGMDEEESDDQEDDLEIDVRVPVESVVYRAPAPRGRPAAERAAAAGAVSDFWRPVQLTPETHVYYRMACTDPVFAERFGGLFAGSVAAFVDQIVHAFFVLNLRHGLGLAPLETPGEEGPDDDDEERPVTVSELRDVFAEMMGSNHSPEGQRARATQNAGAA